MKENKIEREDIVVIIVLSVLLLAMLFSGISKSDAQTSSEWNVAESVIVKKWANYRLHFADGKISEMSCYVADLFENGTQFFCSDDDYEFTNIYGNIVKVEVVEK